jgi:hypothetical protein
LADGGNFRNPMDSSIPRYDWMVAHPCFSEKWKGKWIYHLVISFQLTFLMSKCVSTIIPILQAGKVWSRKAVYYSVTVGI